jgi:hypothetical protein
MLTVSRFDINTGQATGQTMLSGKYPLNVESKKLASKHKYSIC